MQNQSSNIIFDASIRDDDNSRGIRGNLKSNIIKIFDITLDVSRV